MSSGRSRSLLCLWGRLVCCWYRSSSCSAKEWSVQHELSAPLNSAFTASCCTETKSSYFEQFHILIERLYFFPLDPEESRGHVDRGWAELERFLARGCRCQQVCHWSGLWATVVLDSKIQTAKESEKILHLIKSPTPPEDRTVTPGHGHLLHGFGLAFRIVTPLISNRWDFFCFHSVFSVFRLVFCVVLVVYVFKKVLKTNNLHTDHLQECLWFSYFVAEFRRWSSPQERRQSQRTLVRRRSSVERSSANSWTDSCRTRPTTSVSETGWRCVLVSCQQDLLKTWIFNMKVAWVIYVQLFFFPFRFSG